MSPYRGNFSTILFELKRQRPALMSAIACAMKSFIVRSIWWSDCATPLAAKSCLDLLCDVHFVLEIEHHDGKRVTVGLGAGEAELSGRPQAQHLVAPRGCLEPEFLVVRELIFEGRFALVECGHDLGLFV